MNENKKSNYTFVFLLILGFFLIISRSTGPSSEITQDEIMGHIRYLSHPNREGRSPGSRGSKDVISYIIKQFKSYGVKPGVGKSFTQPFDLTIGVALGDTNILIINDDSLIAGQDYTPLSFSTNGSFSGLSVFAGYGFDIKENNLRWSDYSNINVSDKWVIVMRHSPERENQHSIYTPHSSLHKKMIVAKDAGAKGIIFISQIEDDGLYPLAYTRGYNNAGIPAIHLSNDKADKILKKFGWSRKTIQQKMNHSLQPLTFELKNVIIESHVTLKPVKTRAANVIGAIKSGNRKYRDEYVIIGAHFDHLGWGAQGSGSRKPNEKLIHPGADDNASGVAGLLELSQKLSAQKNKLKRSILFIAFDAEEKGLLGAKNFIENPAVDLNKVVTMINMDMIGRMEDSTATVGGVGTSPAFEHILDSLKTKHSFHLSMNQPGFGPSDHAAFYAKDIPVLFFFSGFHNEYHTPDDTWKLINLEGEKNILDLIYDVVFYLARTPKTPVFSKAGPTTGPMSAPKRFKVTFGIMPSYGSTKKGLEVESVSNVNGPAAKAGIKKGDIIKSINGKTVLDIYEYMERLSKLDKGMTVPVIIERGEKNITLDVAF